MNKPLRLDLRLYSPHGFHMARELTAAELAAQLQISTTTARRYLAALRIRGRAYSRRLIRYPEEAAARIRTAATRRFRELHQD